MNENSPKTDKDQQQNAPQQFDYEEHYRQQNRQYQNPQQPDNARYYQNPQQPYNRQYYQPPKPPVHPVPPQPPVYRQYTAPADNTKAFIILSYIGILWLVGLLVDRDNPRVRFHVNQGIILTIFQIAVNVSFSITKSIINIIFIQSFSKVLIVSQLGILANGIISLTGTCLCLVFMIIGILNAAQDRDEPLPIIGTLFQVLK